MAVPAFHEFLSTLLRLASDGAEHRLPVLAPTVANELKLTSDDLAELLPSGVQTRFRNRLAWAKVYLSRAGALETVQRGSFRITERGKQLLAANSQITLATLKQYPEFNSFLGRPAAPGTPEAKGTADAAEEVDTPEETLEAAYASVRASLGQQLLTA
jgi:restriction system protein